MKERIVLSVSRFSPLESRSVSRRYLHSIPIYQRSFSCYLLGVWPSQSERSLGVAGGSSLSSLLWADSLFLSVSKDSGHWVMYTPFLLLLVSPRYLLVLPDGDDVSEGASLAASLPSLTWLSRGSSGGGVIITSWGSSLLSAGKNHFCQSILEVVAKLLLYIFGRMEFFLLSVFK